MSPEFWCMTGVTLTGAAVGIRMAIGEARFVRAQHRAYFEWDRTGKVVPGWSERWRWSHPKDEDVPTTTGVVINVVTTIVNVVHVTNVHVRGLFSGPGAAIGQQGSGATSRGHGTRVTPGQVVPSLPESAGRAAHTVGSLVGTRRGR